MFHHRQVRMSEVDPQDDGDELEALPPIDPAPDDEHEGPDDDELTPLLSSLEEAVDLDEDCMDPEVDLGLEIPETPHDPDDGHEVVLDIGSLLSLADDEVSAEDADGSGPEALDPAADLADLGEPIVGSLEEGTDEPLEDLVSEDLPDLDADDSGEALDESSWLATESLRDEELPKRAERPWQAVHDHEAAGEVEALALGTRRLWAAGRKLYSIAREGGAVSEELPARVLRLAALGNDVLALTIFGSLERVRSGGGAQRIAGWSEALDLSTAGAPELAIAPLVDAGADAFLVAGGTHRIAFTRDGGASFQSAEVGGRIAAVSAGCPARLLVHGTEGWALLDWVGDGLRRTDLDRVAEETAAGEHVAFASMGDIVALCSADRGLVLSVDGGRGFSRIPGCLQVSALELGVRDGRPRIWLALYVESQERSLVIEVDVSTQTAEVIAELSPGDDVAVSEDLEGRARALAWDAEARVLWAAGGSGLWRLVPPEWTA